MRSALLVGHLHTEGMPALGFNDPRVTARVITDSAGALGEVAGGFEHAAPQWKVEVLPFGPGAIFEGQVPGSVILPTGGGPLGTLPTADPLILEMGHDLHHDWGHRLCEVAVADDLRERDIVVAYSTSRPLFGAGGTSNTDPNLQLREGIAEPEGLRSELNALQKQGHLGKALNLVGTDEAASYSRPGSGAGSGAAAWLMALGARAYPTQEVLAEQLRLKERIQAADLVLVATPYWHSPDLADSIPLYAAEVAAKVGVPVVGLGLSSSLSAHEQAQWGVHGLHVARPQDSLDRLGRRVGQTWGRS